MIKRVATVIFAVLILLGMLPASASAVFSGADKIIIVLDPGHGGRDPGASANGVKEKVLTLKLSNLIREKLSANGSFTVYMTRTDDTYISLADRGIYADSVNADLILSVHFDSASGAPSKNGVTAYTSVLDSSAAISLGSSVAAKVAAAAGMNTNGVMRKADTENYYWNSRLQWDIKDVNTGILSDYYGIPTWAAKFGYKALIIEHGFMSNYSDFTKMNRQDVLEKMADAETSAIVAYYTSHSHSYGKVMRDYPSNCVFRGKQSEHCSVCGHRRNITSLPADANAHYWMDSVITPATCGKNGSKSCVCRITQNLNEKGHPIANHTQTAVIPAPSDHDYEVTAAVAATHLQDGYKQFRCRLCGYTFKDVLKAEGHKYQFVLKSEPTCTEAGGNLYRCSVCGNEYRDGPPATGHSFEVTSKTEPTCIEAGSVSYRCKSCGTQMSEKPGAKGHSFETISEKKPSCTQEGFIEEKCKVCSEQKKTVLPASGHKLKTLSEKEPTCSQAGETVSECTVCGDKKTEKINKLTHEYLMTAYRNADCENAGATEFVCRRCGDVFSGTLKSPGHLWKSPRTLSAGLFTGSKKVCSCIYCGKVIKTDIKPEILSSPVWLLAGFSVLALSGALVMAGIALYKRYFKKKISDVKPSEAEAEPAIAGKSKDAP